MRSIFPALHDRHLASLLLGAVVLLVAAIFAISVMVDRDSQQGDTNDMRSKIRFTGASPSN